MAASIAPSFLAAPWRAPNEPRAAGLPGGLCSRSAATAASLQVCVNSKYSNHTWRVALAAGTSMLVVSGWRRRRSTGPGRRQRSSWQAAASAVTAAEESAPICRVARGLLPLSGPQVPVWVFRQAGRHLPEYSRYKAARGKNFLELLQDPEDVAEVTLQPLRRYSVDAAILFSDILVVVEALGIRVEMPGGKGILVSDPLEGPGDLARLPTAAEAATAEFVEARLSHVFKAVRVILSKMAAEGFGSRPLIGFSAAPWTLFFYMVGGSSKRRVDVAERWLVEHEDASKELFSLLTGVVIEYLSAQVRAGCHLLQIFEAMGAMISPEHFRAWAMPALTRIAEELRRRHPAVPLMVFPRGASHSLVELQSAGYDVVTADCDTPLGEVASALRAEAASSRSGRVATLQGNFDPKWLRPSTGSNPTDVRREVRKMITSLGRVPEGPLLIANLGEGLDGTESPELVAAFVDAVHDCSIRAKD